MPAKGNIAAVTILPYVLSGGAVVDYALGYAGVGATGTQGVLLDTATTFNATIVETGADLAAASKSSPLRE